MEAGHQGWGGVLIIGLVFIAFGGGSNHGKLWFYIKNPKAPTSANEHSMPQRTLVGFADERALGCLRAVC